MSEPDGRKGEDLPAVPPPRAPEDLSLVLKPLSDLAEAFRAHSDTLRSLAEGQARIGRRLEKSDRSEAIIQSTQALNETFRGVQRTQERLMGRIDREGKRPWVLVLSVLAALLVFVGGTLWIVLSWLDRREEAERGRESESVTRLVADQTDRLDGLHERLSDTREESADLARRLEAERRRVTELEGRLAEKEEEIRDLEEARGALTRSLRENASLSSEVARLSEELARARDELSKARAEIEAKEVELAERERLLAERKGSSPPDGDAAGRVTTGPRAPVPEEAVTNPAELRRIAGVLNDLLLAAPESGSYRLLHIGGARGKVLYDVTAVTLDEDGEETKRIEASECRIVVDDSLKRAELRFRKGHVFYHGVKAPFWGGSYVVQVVGIDPAAWRRSGLTILGGI